MSIYTPKIKTLPEKKLVGKSISMSLAEDRTPMLWKAFMPLRSTIPNTVGTELISMNVFDGPIDPAADNNSLYFRKWAALEVHDFTAVPEGMGSFTIPAGVYAIFHYKGLSSDTSFFEYIFTEWLPGSAYELDNRPHFQALGDQYRNNDPASEEDIYIPVRLR